MMKLQRCLDVLGILLIAALSRAAEPLRTDAHVPLELAFTAQRPHADPFRDVSLDLLVTAPDGTMKKVPAFWAGGGVWKARYASPQLGPHRWRTACSDAADAGLHGIEGTLEVQPYRGENPLYRHGPIRVAADRRHFEHADGTPFFWLGDTWWMGLCHRLHWPDEFRQLAADRRAKGFTVVQIVAGLYPDMPAFDPRGANESGFPWESEYARIRPEYFDMADRRIFDLVEQGLMPCVVGAWGYHLPWLGEDKLKQHWRYLVARWGALPVVWCAAGEGTMPFYLSRDRAAEAERQRQGWTAVMRDLRETDPFDRLVTVHPSRTARESVTDPAVLDFDMQQTGHGAPAERHAALGREGWNTQPVMPVISGESRYEALEIGRKLDDTDARQAFWMHVLASGVAGGTYGANGIWQVNRHDQPYGNSPGGNNWGTTPWDEAMRLPGSSQLAHAKRFFESLPWSELQPMPDSAAWADKAEPLKLGDWIWYPEGDPKRDAPVEGRYFRRRFELPPGTVVRRAVLRVSADDRFSVWLNGRQIGAGADWSTPTAIDATVALQPGANLLAIRAENGQAPVDLNPAGLNAALEISRADGETICLATDARWRAAKTAVDDWTSLEFDDSDWPMALATARYGDPPWGALSTDPPDRVPEVCGIGDRLRVGYVPDSRPITMGSLRPQAAYRLTRFDPVSGQREPGGEITAGGDGRVRVAPPPLDHDWVVLLEATSKLDDPREHAR